MPPITLSVPGTGGVELMRWFDQGQANNPIEFLQDFILPVMELEEFQVRRFWFQAEQTVLVNDQANFLITMPDDEAMEIDAIIYIHADSVAHEISGQWFASGGGGAFGRMQFFLLPADSLVSTLLYPVRITQNTAAANEDFQYAKPLRIYQGERFQIQDQTPSTDAAPVSTCRVLAHQIPMANLQRQRDELIVGTTF